MSRFSNPFTLQGLADLCGRLAERLPKGYLALALFVTALGYGALLLFPLLTIIAAVNVVVGIGSASGWQDWLGLFAWLLVGAAGGVLSYPLFRLRVPVPSGLGIKSDKAPRLYELIDELTDVYSAPLCERVVVHDEFDVNIIPTPRFGIPVASNFVLRIGLPVLQALSPDQFRACLARRLGQYSARHNRLTHIIYRWNQYCEQYGTIYRKQKQPLVLPYKWFFKLYSPVLRALCIHALRQDELEADRYALEIINDDKLADMIKRAEISRVFLKTKYWPKIHQMLHKQGAKLEHLPHASMTNVLRKGLTDSEANELLEKLRHQPLSHDQIHPGYSQRMENIGHLKDAPPLPLVETAAQRYLGKMSQAIIAMLDKMWLKRYAGVEPKKKALTPPPADAKAQLVALRERLEQGDEDEELLWKIANLSEQVEGKAAAIGHYKQLLKRNPAHAGTIFAVGRILLSQNDPAGVDVLEKAVKLNPGCRAQAYWLLANHFKKNGDADRAKQYLSQATAAQHTSSAA